MTIEEEQKFLEDERKEYKEWMEFMDKKRADFWNKTKNAPEPTSIPPMPKSNSKAITVKVNIETLLDGNQVELDFIRQAIAEKIERDVINEEEH